MAEDKSIVPEDDADVEPVEVAPHRRGPLARLGCGIGLVIWAILLLTPCFLITLAVRGEISLNTGAAPEQRLRIWLVMEARERGLGISTAELHEKDDLTCVQTNVQFVLWQGQADPVSYCQCYQHPPDSDDWSLQEVTSDVCVP